MSTKATGIVSYLTIIGWIIAYAVGDREGAKFHLNQSLVIVISNLVLSIIAKVLGGGILGAVVSVLDLIMFIFWIMGFVYACKQEEKEIPVIGGIRILQ